MNKSNAKQLAECQRKQLEQAAAERIWSSSQEGSSVSSVVSYFDWEIPELTAAHLITFLARVRCQGCERSFRIPIDVAKLATEGRTADLEKLHAILSARHAGLDTSRSLAAAVEWLLGISLEQAEPQLSPSDRRQKVRKLLLVPP
jgi:hypothetical protein